MNIKKTYGEKLQDPKWQRKRLEIMRRDDFTCQLCGDKETTLNVHHHEYWPNTEPWNYPDDNFQTLCRWCHQLVEITKDRGDKVLIAAKWSCAENDIPFFVAGIILRSGKRYVEIYGFDSGKDQLFHMIGISPESMERFNALLTLSEKIL